MYGGGRRGACRVLMGRPERQRPLAKPRRRCKDNIKMDDQAVGWRGLDWIKLSDYRNR